MIQEPPEKQREMRRTAEADPASPDPTSGQDLAWRFGSGQGVRVRPWHVVLFVAVLTHGLVFVVLPLVPTNDAAWYVGLTHAVSQHRVLDPYASGTPTVFDVKYPAGYPLFLDAVWMLFGRGHLSRGLLLVQHLIGVCSALLLCRIGSSLDRPRAGLFAALAYCLYMPASVYCHAAMTETLFTFLCLAALLCALTWMRHNRLAILALAGVLLGMATTVRPVALFFVVALGIATFCRWRVPLRVRLQRLVALGVPIAGLGLMLLVHNGLWYGRWVLTDDVGRHWINRVWDYDGSFDPEWPIAGEVIEHCKASGVHFRIPGCWWEFYRALRAGSGLGAADADRLMKAAAMEGIRRHPWRYVWGTGPAFVHVLAGRDTWLPSVEWIITPVAFTQLVARWCADPDDAATFHLPPLEFGERRAFLELFRVTPPRVRSARLLKLLQVWWRFPRYDGTMVWLFVAGAVAILLFGRRGDRLLLVFILAMLAPCALFEDPVPRYREPVVPVMLLVAIAGLSEALLRLHAREKRATPSAGPVDAPAA